MSEPGAMAVDGEAPMVAPEGAADAGSDQAADAAAVSQVATLKCHRCQHERPYSEYDPMGDGSTAPHLSPFCRNCLIDEQLRTQIQELLAAQVVESLPEEHASLAHATNTTSHQPSPLSHPHLNLPPQHSQPSQPTQQHLAPTITAEHPAEPGQQPQGSSEQVAPPLDPLQQLDQSTQSGGVLVQGHASQQHLHQPQDGADPSAAGMIPAEGEAHLLPQQLGEDAQVGHHHHHHHAVLSQQQQQQQQLDAAAQLDPLAAAQVQMGDPNAGAAAAAAHAHLEHAQIDPAAAAAAAAAMHAHLDPSQLAGMDPHSVAAATALHAQLSQMDPHSAAAAAAAAASAQRAALHSMQFDPSMPSQMDPSHLAAHLDQAALAQLDHTQLSQLLHGGMALSPEAYAALYQQHAAAAAAAAMGGPAYDISQLAAGGMLGMGEGGEGTHKVCSKCKLERPMHDFPELKGKKRGRSTQCSDCKGMVDEGRRRRAEAAALSSGEGEGEGEGELLNPAAMGAMPAGLDIPLLTEKQCMHCMHVKPVHLFRRSKNKTDKLQNRCKECETLLGRGTKRDRNGPVVVKVAHKLCRRCGLDKDASQFFQSKLSLDGLCTYCKACQKDLNKLARAKRPDVSRPEITIKKCRHCKLDRPASQYFKSKMNLDGLYSYCKTCATVLNSASKKRRRAEIRAQRLAGQGAGMAGGQAAAGATAAASRLAVAGGAVSAAMAATSAAPASKDAAALAVAAVAPPQSYVEGADASQYDGSAAAAAYGEAAAVQQQYEAHHQYEAAGVHHQYDPNQHFDAQQYQQYHEGMVHAGYDPAAAAAGHYGQPASLEWQQAYHDHALATQQYYQTAEGGFYAAAPTAEGEQQQGGGEGEAAAAAAAAAGDHHQAAVGEEQHGQQAPPVSEHQQLHVDPAQLAQMADPHAAAAAVSAAAQLDPVQLSQLLQSGMGLSPDAYALLYHQQQAAAAAALGGAGYNAAAAGGDPGGEGAGGEATDVHAQYAAGGGQEWQHQGYYQQGYYQEGYYPDQAYYATAEGYYPPEGYQQQAGGEGGGVAVAEQEGAAPTTVEGAEGQEKGANGGELGSVAELGNGQEAE